MAYDSRCFDLAEVFLKDDPSVNANRAHQLAQRIQSTVEDWFEFQKTPCHGCGQPIGNGDHSKCVLF